MKMKRIQAFTPFLLAVFAVVLLGVQPLFAADPDPKAIMDKVNINRKLEGSEALQSLVIISKKDKSAFARWLRFPNCTMKVKPKNAWHVSWRPPMSKVRVC